MVGLLENSSFYGYHPIVSFVYFVFVIAISMTVMNPWFLVCSYIVSFSYSVILKGKSAFKFNVFTSVCMLIICPIFNMLFVHSGKTILFYMYENAITVEVIIYGFAMGLMLSSVLMWFSCYQVIMTSDKFIYLFGRIAPTLALTISMIFRYIPLIRKRFNEITEGQKCMGRDLKSGSFLSRLHQAAREVSILIAWSLEGAIETSDSMESRGYGIFGRTSFNLFKFSKLDGRVLCIVFLLGGLVLTGCGFHKCDIYYYPVLMYPLQDIYSFITYGLYLILLLIPVIIDIGGELRWKQLLLKM